MITWLFDRQNQYGFLPNLVKDITLKPNTPEWWDLCLQPPFSMEFVFLKYCKFEHMQLDCRLVSEYTSLTTSAYYPISLNFFDPEIDYLALMDPKSLERLKRKDFKVLFYYSEGDNPQPEIYDSLQRMCSTHDIHINSLRFVIGNYHLRNEFPFVFFNDMECHYRYIQLLDNKFVKEQNFESREKRYTCLIRASKIWRKIYANFLYQLGHVEKGYFSYTNYTYEVSHKGLDDIDQWVDYDDTLISDLAAFDLHTPFKTDDLDDQAHNDHKLVNQDFYQNAYWNFAVETHFDNGTIFLTEKTFKPILNLQPFIIIGNAGSLDLLREMGYKTFGEVINERYDEITDYRERMSVLAKISHDLINLSNSHHMRIQAVLADTLLHNQKHFLASKQPRLQAVLDQLEY